MLSISFYFVYVPNFHPAFSAKQLTIHNVFQAESFNFIEGGAGNSSELIHSYVNPFTRSSVTSRSEYKLYNRISVIVVSRMMLNLMEAVDPLGGDFSEDSNYHPEGRPNLSTFQIATQNSVPSTGPLGRSTQLPFDFADESVSSAPW